MKKKFRCQERCPNYTDKPHTKCSEHLTELEILAQEFISAVGVIEETYNELFHGPKEQNIKFYHALNEHDRPYLIKYADNKMVTTLFNQFDFTDTITELNEIYDKRREAYVIYCIPENNRIKLVNHYSQYDKKFLHTILKELNRLQRHIESDSGEGISYKRIMTGSFTKKYPHTYKRCIQCKEPYNLLCDIYRAECKIHSFHSHCRKNCLACPICQ
jgi:hypothetical protein